MPYPTSKSPEIGVFINLNFITMAEVYVGTYKKYNNGSIAGAWVDLSEFKTYDEFVKKCKAIHNDERYPEFMIQDCSDMPDGLTCSEWISEEEFNDILAALKEEEHEQKEEPKYQIIDYSDRAIAVVGDTKDIKDQLKKLGGRFNFKLSCGAGWIFPKSKLDELQKLLNCGEVAATSDGSANIYKVALDAFLATCNDRDREYYKKYNVGAVEVLGGYYLLPKYHIENQFCWADEGEDYEAYKHITSSADRLAKYFVERNLNEVDRKIKVLKESHEVYIGVRGMSVKTIHFYQPYAWGLGKDQPSDEEITQEQRDLLIAGLQYARKMFEKRLQTYLKKYGVSKLHTWTYWRDA